MDKKIQTALQFLSQYHIRHSNTAIQLQVYTAFTNYILSTPPLVNSNIRHKVISIVKLQKLRSIVL